MSLSTIDLIVVIAYAIGIFSLAQWVSREKAGHQKDTSDYFLASKNLPWWAIGASLIAANISAEQIVGMSGSGYAIGLAIASYEWMAALTLLIVGKFFLPIFLKNHIYTMPQFLERRYGRSIRTLMAWFWLALYVFVNLTSIIWLGSIAVNKVAGINQNVALVILGSFALLYQLRGGLKAVALTDIVQVTLLVLGGLVVAYLTLTQIGGGDLFNGFHQLVTTAPDHFHMILKKGDPHYIDLPGLSVLIGGMWIANVAYWGFNQYIIQRALAAKSLDEAQRGVIFAAFLKLLMPVIIVLPGIAAVVLAPGLPKPDEAYPTMMRLLPPGLLGLVFAALVAAIIASTASKINSIATIFTLDVYAKRRGERTKAEDDSGESMGEEKHLVLVGRITAITAIIIAIIAARPLVGSVYFMMSESPTEVTAATIAPGSFARFQNRPRRKMTVIPGVKKPLNSWMYWNACSELPTSAFSQGVNDYLTPFINRMGVVFLVSLVLAVIVSLATPQRPDVDTIDTTNVRYKTSSGFNVGALGVVLILVALYATWW
jgi:SSS family solute:Na+ symporter